MRFLLEIKKSALFPDNDSIFCPQIIWFFEIIFKHLCDPAVNKQRSEGHLHDESTSRLRCAGIHLTIITN
jgi:hypothetical protein